MGSISTTANAARIEKPSTAVAAASSAGAGMLPMVRLFTANVHDANPDVGSIAEEVAAKEPDLVALQEVDPDGAAGLGGRAPSTCSRTR